MPLSICEIKPDLSWSENCIISEQSITTRLPANPDANPPVQEVATIQTTGATFQIIDAKLYVPVVTLFIYGNVKFKARI